MKWRKPSGAEIETNDREATIAAAEALGWERVKRKRRTKAEMEAAKVVDPSAEAVENAEEAEQADGNDEESAA